ncbi:MAG: family 1 encapsulin nanocompartment shell protein [Candidatus Thorarchaeota archaeon]
MRSIMEFRMDSPVMEQAYKHIDTAVKEAAKRSMIGRKLLPIYGPLGFETESISYWKLTEMGDAHLNYGWKISKSEDVVNLVPATINIPVLDKTFRINRRSLAQAVKGGYPIDTASAKSAAYAVARLEDEIIIDGYKADGSNYDIKGLYQINIDNKITGSEWTDAPEDAIADTQAGMAYLMDANIDPPYNWVLHPTQYNELVDVGASKHTNALIVDTVRKQLMGGDIYYSSVLTAGTGFMMPAGDRGFFDLSVGVDVTTEMEELDLGEGRDLFGVVWECVVPRIWQTDAVVPFDTL